MHLEEHSNLSSIMDLEIKEIHVQNRSFTVNDFIEVDANYQSLFDPKFENECDDILVISDGCNSFTTCYYRTNPKLLIEAAVYRDVIEKEAIDRNRIILIKTDNKDIILKLDPEYGFYFGRKGDVLIIKGSYWSGSFT